MRFALTITLTSVVVTLIISECLLRIGFIPAPPTFATVKEESLEYDPSIFSRHVISRGPKDVIDPATNATKYHINQFGFRGDEFKKEVSSGITRIMFYGGSSTFDTNASEGKDWPHLVGQNLKDISATKVECINAGTPGHATFDNVGTLFSEGHIFKPNIVALYNTWNDIKYFTDDSTLLRSTKPFDRKHNAFMEPLNSLDYFFSNNLITYRLIRAGWYTFATERNLEEAQKYKPGSKQIYESALTQFKLNVETFVDVVRNIGAVPVLITEAHLASPTNSETAKSKIAYTFVGLNHEQLLTAYGNAEEIIRNVSVSKSVKLIDASHEMSGKELQFIDHVHLSNDGSSMLAKIVSNELDQLILERSNAFSPSRKITN